ncbi:Phenylacetaldoxime dehydratase [Penicillium waksmanii]|uniref:Phenylacetaldoxime dehydratase n=1 Tax=Penicillium waksmanii TaxID=69791 RepID=UPI0025491EC4|nr:Phenylacetaldoxime dehydratase [Penicillium waksmanii]KAJ5966434.1 Phenylacetaldoxime dehydratase [Penicillium waksmanii]
MNPVGNKIASQQRNFNFQKQKFSIVALPALRARLISLGQSAPAPRLRKAESRPQIAYKQHVICSSPDHKGRETENIKTMTCTMASDTRTYPLRQPAKHNPPPRLHLVFPETQKQVFTAYIGIQLHSQTCKNTKEALSLLSEPRSDIQTWLAKSTPISTEQFFVLDDMPNHRQTSIPTQAQAQDSSPIQKSTTLIWACYWSTQDSYQKAVSDLNLSSLHTSLPESLRPSIGFWAECFISDISRLETVYSATDYMPGLARLPGTSTTKHLHTGYWGAARDRIPGSGEDLFTGDGAVRNDGNGESAAAAEEGEEKMLISNLL